MRAGRAGRLRANNAARAGWLQKVKPSRSIPLFERVIQTSGGSASGHHALAVKP
jgi:hypothetical protein